jgi:2-polyprenyl-3-methyl-5-hydroxy-6-metoxy-1,4-benzoquinol methylase
MKCLLCKSESVIIKENIDKETVSKLWKQAGVDAEPNIKTEGISKYQCKDCSLLFYDPVNAGDNRFYSVLGNYEWYYMHPGKTEYDYVKRYIHAGDSILDIGAGRGELFNRISVPVNYQGVELSTKAAELAKSANINVRKENLFDHVLQNRERYDLICIFQVLEHLTEFDRFTETVKSCLKPGGRICVAVPNNNGFISFVSNDTFNLPPHHTVLWTEQTLRYFAKRFGLEIEGVVCEPLQEVHMYNAYLSYMVAIAKKLLLIPVRTVDDSKLHHFITESMSILYRRSFFQKLFLPLIKKRVKHGQSILITYRLPEALR